MKKRELKTHVAEVIRGTEDEAWRNVLLLDVLQLQLDVLTGDAAVNLVIVIENLK